jgi:hypothetical protein
LGHAFERLLNLDVSNLSNDVLSTVLTSRLLRINALNHADEDGLGALVGVTHGGVATTTASINGRCVKK